MQTRQTAPMVSDFWLYHDHCGKLDFPVPRKGVGGGLLVLFLFPTDLLPHRWFQLFLSVQGHHLLSDLPKPQGKGICSVYPQNVMDADLRHYHRYASEYGGAAHVAGKGYYRLSEADAYFVGHCHSAAASGILLYPRAHHRGCNAGAEQAR